MADFGARLGLALLSAFVALEPRYIYLAGAIGFLITRVGMHLPTYTILRSCPENIMLFHVFTVFLYTFSFSGMIVIAVFLGIFRTLIHVPVSLIYAGHLPPERLIKCDRIFFCKKMFH